MIVILGQNNTNKMFTHHLLEHFYSQALNHVISKYFYYKKNPRFKLE